MVVRARCWCWTCHQPPNKALREQTAEAVGILLGLYVIFVALLVITGISSNPSGA